MAEAVIGGGLFLPDGYWERLQPERHDDFLCDGGWQAEVYKLAVRRAEEYGLRRILDLGAGNGLKLLEHRSRFKLTLVEEVVTAERLSESVRGMENGDSVRVIAADLNMPWQCPVEADLVICADVLEHLCDPRPLLGTIRRVLQESATWAFLSTPARELGDHARMGPPRNPSHVREWSSLEFVQLLRANGLEVVRTLHVAPREGHEATTLCVEVVDA